MNYDVIRLRPSDLDHIYKQLSTVKGRELFCYEALSHIPLPKLTLEYYFPDHPDLYNKYQEHYEFETIDDESFKLHVYAESEKTINPVGFSVIVVSTKDGQIAFRGGPIYDDFVTDKTKEVLGKEYSDEMITCAKTWESFPARFLNVNIFLSRMTPELICDIKTEARKASSKSPHRAKKKKSANKVCVYKVYRLKENWKDITKEHRHNLVVCPAWGVRGHYRHYKDGRVVWVKAFVKGKDRDHYQGKEYKLFKDDKMSS